MDTRDQVIVYTDFYCRKLTNNILAEKIIFPFDQDLHYFPCMP